MEIPAAINIYSAPTLPPQRISTTSATAPPSLTTHSDWTPALHALTIMCESIKVWSIAVCGDRGILPAAPLHPRAIIDSDLCGHT